MGLLLIFLLIKRSNSIVMCNLQEEFIIHILCYLYIKTVSYATYIEIKIKKWQNTAVKYMK